MPPDGKEYFEHETHARKGASPAVSGGSAFLRWAVILMTVAEARAGKPVGLLLNEDCTNFFYYQTSRRERPAKSWTATWMCWPGPAWSVLLCNTNARRTNYRSGVWEAFWTATIPTAPTTSRFLAAVPQEGRKTFRKLVGNMLEVHRQGVDYPGRMIQALPPSRHHAVESRCRNERRPREQQPRPPVS